MDYQPTRLGTKPTKRRGNLLCEPWQGSQGWQFPLLFMVQIETKRQSQLMDANHQDVVLSGANQISRYSTRYGLILNRVYSKMLVSLENVIRTLHMSGCLILRQIHSCSPEHDLQLSSSWLRPGNLLFSEQEVVPPLSWCFPMEAGRNCLDSVIGMGLIETDQIGCDTRWVPIGPIEIGFTSANLSEPGRWDGYIGHAWPCHTTYDPGRDRFEKCNGYPFRLYTLTADARVLEEFDASRVGACWQTASNTINQGLLSLWLPCKMLRQSNHVNTALPLWVWADLLRKHQALVQYKSTDHLVAAKASAENACDCRAPTIATSAATNQFLLWITGGWHQPGLKQSLP